MIPHTRKCFILIVHHGNQAPTQQLLQSLKEQTILPEHIVVVDHGDTPLSPISPSTSIHVIRPTENSGYAGGLNVALGFLSSKYDIASEDIIVCMNNDVRLAPDSLQKLMAWWEERPLLTLAGIKMGYVNMCTGRAVIDDENVREATNLHVPYIHGAFFAAPLRVLTTLGGVPDTLFLYWEDVLLSWRARRQGIQLKALGDVGVRHSDIDETPSSQKLYYLIRNGAFVLEQEAPGLWRLYWKVRNRMRFMYHWTQERTSVTTRALRDALRGKLGKVAI